MSDRFFKKEGELFVITGATCRLVDKKAQFCLLGVPLSFYKSIKEAKSSLGTHIYSIDEIEEIEDPNIIDLIQVLYG